MTVFFSQKQHGHTSVNFQTTAGNDQELTSLKPGPSGDQSRDVLSLRHGNWRHGRGILCFYASFPCSLLKIRPEPRMARRQVGARREWAPRSWGRPGAPLITAADPAARKRTLGDPVQGRVRLTWGKSAELESPAVINTSELEPSSPLFRLCRVVFFIGYVIKRLRLFTVRRVDCQRHRPRSVWQEHRARVHTPCGFSHGFESSCVHQTGVRAISKVLEGINLGLWSASPSLTPTPNSIRRQ